ncbi:phosphoenolpyruvate mutase [Bacillus sp. DNRA2]|uniref:phosphoenolpyruvate mutase n=1 Tax=Bacillus sp. DNRA2 TaxID=2723053 RepID=UPI00145DF221|nr:phosphoenolpyruvate mutase [Bacillus sp. DNRA2]NMD71376.1 phosphoenolpyruvate mutase [Bacillus sp. DNRA2]
MKKTTQLRGLITSKPLEFIMEAHNALSAKIVEEAGFKGIWGSGLSISASLGVRDNNEASWTQVLDVLEFMSDATSIPILLDGDTGYGNFNNARRLVKKLEQRNIGGVCIEDKIFPKTNSFIKGEAQPLADIDEFSGKIKAMKDSQSDDDFVVVSRVEAFIAGWGLSEALKRAEAYRKAGTDAILMHSKRADFNEIEAFMKEWAGRLPVVIVPTKYYSVPTDRFREIGVDLCIWANHNLRASIKAIKQTASQIYREESLINVEKNVTPLEEVFRLQGAEELSHAEKIYLNNASKNRAAIIINNEQSDHPLLAQQVNSFKDLGIGEIITLQSPNHTDSNSKSGAAEGELAALYSARERLAQTTIISSADIVYKPYVINELLSDPSDITIVVDPEFDVNTSRKCFVTAKQPYSKMLYSKSAEYAKMTAKATAGEVHGEFIGVWKVSGNGSALLKQSLETLALRDDFHELTWLELFNYLQTLEQISVKYLKGAWLDFNTYMKIQSAGESG